MKGVIAEALHLADHWHADGHKRACFITDYSRFGSAVGCLMPVSKGVLCLVRRAGRIGDQAKLLRCSKTAGDRAMEVGGAEQVVWLT